MTKHIPWARKEPVWKAVFCLLTSHGYRGADVARYLLPKVAHVFEKYKVDPSVNVIEQRLYKAFMYPDEPENLRKRNPKAFEKAELKVSEYIPELRDLNIKPNPKSSSKTPGKSATKSSNIHADRRVAAKVGTHYDIERVKKLQRPDGSVIPHPVATD